jgi:hypothetical protein
MTSRYALAALSALMGLAGGGGYSSPARPDRSFCRPRQDPTYASPPPRGWQRKPFTGKRWYWKRKYVRRRSGYFMHRPAKRYLRSH